MVDAPLPTFDPATGVIPPPSSPPGPLPPTFNVATPQTWFADPARQIGQGVRAGVLGPIQAVGQAAQDFAAAPVALGKYVAAGVPSFLGGLTGAPAPDAPSLDWTKSAGTFNPSAHAAGSYVAGYPVDADHPAAVIADHAADVGQAKAAANNPQAVGMPGAKVQPRVNPEQQSRIINGLTADQAIRLYEIHLAHAGVPEAARVLLGKANFEYNNSAAASQALLDNNEINATQHSKNMLAASRAHTEALDELMKMNILGNYTGRQMQNTEQR